MRALVEAFRQRGVPDHAANLAAQVGMAALGQAISAGFENESTDLGFHVEHAFEELSNLVAFAQRSGDERGAR